MVSYLLSSPISPMAFTLAFMSEDEVYGVFQFVFFENVYVPGMDA